MTPLVLLEIGQIPTSGRLHAVRERARQRAEFLELLALKRFGGPVGPDGCESVKYDKGKMYSRVKNG